MDVVWALFEAFVVRVGVRIVVGLWSRVRGRQRRRCAVTVRDDTEVSFRPFVRVAVALDIENSTDRPLRFELAELDAMLRRGWTRRFEPVPFEAFQVNGHLIAADEDGHLPPFNIPACERMTCFVHFSRPAAFEMDALRHFLFTMRVSGQRRQRVLFRVMDTYAANIRQSTVHVVGT